MVRIAIDATAATAPPDAVQEHPQLAGLPAIDGDGIGIPSLDRALEPPQQPQDASNVAPTAAAAADSAPSPPSAAAAPSAPPNPPPPGNSKDTNTTRRSLASRTHPDGSVEPSQPAARTADGLYPRMAGRGLKGYDWDEKVGRWVPVKVPVPSPPSSKGKKKGKKGGAEDGAEDSSDDDGESSGKGRGSLGLSLPLGPSDRNELHASILRYFAFRSGVVKAQAAIAEIKAMKDKDYLEKKKPPSPPVEVDPAKLDAVIDALREAFPNAAPNLDEEMEEKGFTEITDLEKRFAAAGRTGTEGSKKRKRSSEDDEPASKKKKKKKARKPKGKVARLRARVSDLKAKHDDLKARLKEKDASEKEANKALVQLKKKEKERMKEEKKKGVKGRGPRASWDERFAQLLEYRSAYGHANVPRRYPPNHQLGFWVQNQRMLYKKLRAGQKTKQLDEERIARLNEIGFSWWAQGHETRPWEERLEDLLEFKKTHGHCRVPKNYTENPQLAEWVKTQRKMHKKKDTAMQGERTRKLQEAGFEFVVAPSVKSWDERYLQLVEFRRVHGHVDVPAATDTMPTGPDGLPVGMTGTDADDERAFRRWAHRQRPEYWKFEEGKRSCLDRGRVRKLERLGFTWGRNG